jgi:DHA1 family multidrug resistance protein-like MFS transporter
MTAERTNLDPHSSTTLSQSSFDMSLHADGRTTPQESLEGMETLNGALADIEKAEPEDAPTPLGEKRHLVEFDGPKDPDNPKNWTQKKRWAVTWCMGLLVFTVTFASSIFSVNIRVVQEKFDVTMVTATLGVALFVLVSNFTLLY